MLKPPSFWPDVARAVNAELRKTVPDMPTYDELDEAGKASMEIVCIEAVKQATRLGRALMPAEIEK